MLAGLLCGSVFLVFAVSVTTAAASVARSTLATVGITLGDYLPALATAAAGSALLLAVATVRLARRDV